MSDEDGNTTIVRLSGNVDVSNIAEAHRALVEAFAAHDAIAVDIGELGETDLTLVQLLESAHRTASARGKRFSLTAPASGALHEMLMRGGFLASSSTSANFWLHQGD